MSVDLTGYDLVDFGCSKGGSMEFAFKHLGCRSGIGIDIDPQKVETTRALGYDAQVADLTKLDNFSGKSKVAILSHILEHIPQIRQAEQILNVATAIATDFVLVRQPWFDCDGPLAQLGLKLYWSDWTGHTNHMSSLQMYQVMMRLFDAGLISSFSIWGHNPVLDSSDDVLVPLDSGRDRHHYDAQKDQAKTPAKLRFPCYRELMAYVGVSKDVDTRTLPRPFGNATRLFHRYSVEP